MGKGERPLRPFTARDDYSHPLGLLDDGEKFINVDRARRGEKLKAETAPDNRGGCQHLRFIVVEPLQAPADHQAHVLRNVDLINLDVSAELAGRIEDSPVFDADGGTPPRRRMDCPGFPQR